MTSTKAAVDTIYSFFSFNYKASAINKQIAGLINLLGLSIISKNGSYKPSIKYLF